MSESVCKPLFYTWLVYLEKKHTHYSRPTLWVAIILVNFKHKFTFVIVSQVACFFYTVTKTAFQWACTVLYTMSFWADAAGSSEMMSYEWYVSDWKKKEINCSISQLRYKNIFILSNVRLTFSFWGFCFSSSLEPASERVTHGKMRVSITRLFIIRITMSSSSLSQNKITSS